MYGLWFWIDSTFWGAVFEMYWNAEIKQVMAKKSEIQGKSTRNINQKLKEGKNKENEKSQV